MRTPSLSGFDRCVYSCLAALAMAAGEGCSSDGSDKSQSDATQSETDVLGDALADAQGDVQGDTEADANAPAPVEAGGFASLTGVVSYGLTLVLDGAGDAPPTVKIALTGLDGAELGVIDIAFEPTGLTASVASPVGPIVYRAGAAVTEDRLFVSNSVNVGGRELRLDITSALDAEGVPTEESAMLLAPGDPGEVTGAAHWSGPESGVVALVLASAGQSPSHEVVAAWIGDVVPASLLSSPELLRLIAAMLDPALGAALAAAIDEYAPTSANALHLSPTCTSFRDRVHIGVRTNDACRACAALDPSPRGPLPSPRPSLGTLWALLPACRTCLVGAAAISPDLINCAYAFFLSERHFTDAYCQSAPPAAPPGMRRRASADAHSCATIPVCDASLCTSACEARAAREGLEVEPGCSADGRLCDCGIDWDAFCRARHGTANCGPATVIDGIADCDVAECDDGVFSATCGENPGSAEACDTLDPGSCGTGYCAVDCTRCVDCECSVRGAACPGDEVCDGCRCGPRLTCADEGPGAVGWCDPEDADAWCGDGACDAQTCRCVAAPPECGDGALDADEACDPPGGGCPEGFVCGATCSCEAEPCTPGCPPGACNVVDDCGDACECEGSEVCNQANRCEACAPDCDRGERGACGPTADGCGGPCECQGSDTCDAGRQLCVCIPACATGRCGDDMDGCGGPCSCQGANEGCELETNTCVVSPPPTGLVATAGEGEVTLTWPAFVGATSYNAYVGFAPGGTIANDSKITGATSPLVVRGLAPDLPAYFVLTAVTGSRESSASAEVTATPRALRDTTAPTVVFTAPMAELVGVDPADPIRVGFSEPLDRETLTTGFTVTGAGAVSGVRTQVGLEVRFVTNVPLAPATRYTVNLTTALKDPAGNALATAKSFGFTTRPAAPSVAVIQGYNAATLTWAAVEGATGYAIHRGPAPGGPYTVVAGTLRTHYSDAQVYADSYYLVTAFTAAGESRPSAEVHASPSVDPLPTPGNARARAGNTEALVSWDSSGPGSIYTLLRFESPTGTSTIVRDDITSVTHRDLGLINGARYHYVVHARNGAKRSAWSAEADVIPQAELPKAPTFVNASVSEAGVALDWGQVASASGYLVYATVDYPGVDGDGVELRPSVIAGATTNSVLLPLSEGWTYRFSVAAMNGIGLVGAPSPEVLATPLGFPTPGGAPAAPSTDLAAQPGRDCVTLSWDFVPGVVWYYVYRAEVSGPSDSYIGYTGAFDNRWTECGLSPNTSYNYVLRSQDSAGIFSVNSAVIETATSNSLAAQTTIVSAFAGQGQVVLGWTPAAGATRYHVHRRSEHSGWQQLATTTGLGWIDSSVADESPYFYAVEGDNGVKRGVLSLATSELTPKDSLPAAPSTRLVAQPGDGCVTISWDVVPGAVWNYLYRTGASAGPYPASYLAYTGNGNDNRYTDCGLRTDAVFTASAATDTLTFTEDHGYVVNDPVVLSGTGLAAPLVAGTTYYVASAPGASTITLATTQWGAKIDLTSNGSGTQKALYNYYYVVRTQDSSGLMSGHSVELSARPSASRPAPAVIGYQNLGKGQLALDWAAAPRATRYHVHRRTEHSAWQQLTASTTSGLGFVDRGVVDGVSYAYAIESDDGTNRGIFSVPTGFLVPDATRPEPPSTHLAAQPGNTCVTLSWDFVPGASWSYVYSAEPGGGPYQPSYVTYSDGSDNRATVCELENETPHYFVLRTQDMNGLFSGVSVELAVTPSDDLPLRAEGLVVSPGGSKALELSWSPVADVLGYRVSRRSDGTSWVTIGQTTGPAFSDDGLSSGTTYHYAVQTFSLAGAGAVSSSASAVAP